MVCVRQNNWGRCWDGTGERMRRVTWRLEMGRGAKKHLDGVQRWLEKEMGLLWALSREMGMNRKEMKERDKNTRRKASLW